MDVLENWRSALSWRCVIGRAYESAIVGDLAAGRIDALCSAAAVTAERARDVDFCTPHLALTLALVMRAGDPAGLQLDGRRARADDALRFE